MPRDPLNLLVFRESRRRVDGNDLESALTRELQSLSPISSPDRVTRALLRAGELECAIADATPSPTQPCLQLTDTLADALVNPGSLLDASSLARSLACATTPQRVCISPPEGFAYYAVHPLAFADALRTISDLGASVAVVGIRSIGTTLSAVVAAAARKLGSRAERTTVRPSGHPYSRYSEFSASQLEFIRIWSSYGARFVVVDEGPGLSGSSFLSVAEALERAGVPADKITLLCAHVPDFESLCADDALRRAQRFSWIAAAATDLRPQATGMFIGGGEWRKLLYRAAAQEWPPTWTSLERLKYLLARDDENAKRLFKFLGFGHYGEPVLDRETLVAQGGFGPLPRREANGFAAYPWISGRPMAADDLSEHVLQRLAGYCAFRANSFATTDSTNINALQQMAEHNLRALGLEGRVALGVQRPVICDGRMQPHEWLLTHEGQMLKTDSGSHGDDHFLPGPTDIAWDLAGAIIEWKMTAAQANFFLDSYCRASGDDPSQRITDFVIAYTVFRYAYNLMAASALHGSDEEIRLRFAAAQYGKALPQLTLIETI